MSTPKRRWIRFATCVLTAGVWLAPAVGAQDQDPPHNCDMAAVITQGRVTENRLIANMPDVPGSFNDPQDFFYDFIIERSTVTTNPDGYRVVFYSDLDAKLPDYQLTYPYPYWSGNPYDLGPGPLDDARDDIMDPDNEAVIVMAHARNGTGGAGNHPFTFAAEDRTWTFMHNGGILDEGDTPDIKYALWNDLYHNTGTYNGAWFDAHPSNWVSRADVGDYREFIDSEILFHWIMKNILAEDGDVLAGLYTALTAEVPNPAGGMISLFSEFTQRYDDNRVNFVLCDGEALFVFRNTPTFWGHHDLSYQVIDDGGRFIAVKTQAPLPNPIPQFTLAYLPRFGSPIEFPFFPFGPGDTRIVPTDYLTIQEAIDASSHGDVVLVRPGTYPENIDFHGLAITVRSDEDGDPETKDLAPGRTFINGNHLGTTASFLSEETRLSRLVGFTILNGEARLGANKFGGGIWCTGFSSPTLIKNVITENEAKYGGGISCLADASPLIAWNTIWKNTADSSGGGLHLDQSLSTITHNTIKENVGGAVYPTAQGGGLAFKDCELKLINNLIVGNVNLQGRGGAISSNASQVLMTNDTVSGNQDNGDGQGCDGLYIYNQSTLSVFNTILWGNDAHQPFEVRMEGPGNYAGFDYSDLQGGQNGIFCDPGSIFGWGTSMIDADPRFVGGSDYHLRGTSPCIDRGWNQAPGIPELDLDGRARIQLPWWMGGHFRVDMGAYEFCGLVADRVFTR